jgi:hypothetical protein
LVAKAGKDIDNMEQASQITISVLVTKDEYIQAEAIIKQKLRSKFAPIITISGIVFVVLGIAGLFFGRLISLSPPAAGCFVTIGIFLALFDNFIGPILNRAAAAREYLEKEDLHFATSYVFSGDRVKISNGRIKGEFPVSMITRWTETPALFNMSVGRELNMTIPKRMLSDCEINNLRRILEKYAPDAVM